MSAHKPFTTVRINGLSNTQVLCELIGAKPPGTVLSYADLSAALERGTTRKFSRRDVQQAIRQAGPQLGKLHQRAMQCVPTHGYRLALATEHLGLALCKRTEAMRKMKRGLQILRDVRLDEIKDPAARQAHEGQFLILSGQMAMLGSHEKRLARIENLIAQRA